MVMFKVVLLRHGEIMGETEVLARCIIEAHAKAEAVCGFGRNTTSANFRRI